MRRAAPAIALVLIVPLLLLPPPVDAHHHSPIQPGASFLDGSGSWCSLNLVFRDGSGALYVGAAAHCSPPLNARVASEEVGGAFGTVVYRVDQGGNGVAHKDFALFRVDDDKHHLVDPAMRRWGGPTGIETDFLPGTPLVHAGQGVFVSAVGPARERAGALHFRYGETSVSNGADLDGWYLATLAVVGGDSGSAVLTATGKALGTVIGAAVTWGEPGWVNGPTFVDIVADLRAAGFDVEIVTAPLNPTGTVEDAIHCAQHPYSPSLNADTCLRSPYPLDRAESVDPNAPDGPREALVGSGHILAGGPHVAAITLSRYAYEAGNLAPVEHDAVPAADGFVVGAPAAGTAIGAFAIRSAPAPFDLDIHFYDPVGNQIRVPECSSPLTEERCRVPAGAGLVHVVAYAGADLDVEVWTLGQNT